MTLHRIAPNDPLKKDLIERPRWFLCGHGLGRRQLDHLRDRYPAAVTIPGRHQRAPTLEQIAAPVTAFDRALDAMPERLLDHLMRKARSLVAPIFEAGAKTVRHLRGFLADSPKQLGE